MKKYVIIGNGAAGASALERIRALDPQASITVFSKEKYPFYYRPRLPEFLAGEVALEKFTMHSLEQYKQWQVDFRAQTEVTAIDPKGKAARTQDGRETPYDALLLACGANANIPPLPGADKKGVFSLRRVDDAIALRQAASQTSSAILVGGGLLGLEAGHGLIKLGLKVQVVEFFDRLLPRQMDRDGAAMLQAMLEAMGFEFYLGARSREVSGRERAGGLVLEDGRELKSPLILFSAGIAPDLALARSLGKDLRVDKAIVVDEYMRSSIEGVYAAGDAAEFGGMPGGIWPVALSQGRIAGANMTGTPPLRYQPQAPSTTLKIAGISLVSAGNIDADAKLPAAVARQDGYYRKIVLDQGKIAGLIFLGDTAGVKQCQEAMNKGLDVSSHLAALSRRDFDFTLLKTS
jgi:nitrite reductase (NADH) large subunit